MLWFGDKKSNKLDITWEYATHGNLWRLVPSNNGHFVIEDRDVEKKNVSFTCLDRVTGKIIWEHVQFSEKWWVTIDVVHNNMLFLHEYASPDLPESKKIIAVDIFTGKLVWSNDDMKFLFVHGDCIYAAKDEYDQRKFFQLSLLDGVVLREIDDQYLSVIQETCKGVVENTLVFPVSINEGDNEQMPASVVQKATADASNVSLIEHVSHGNTDVVGYYESTSEALTQQKYCQHITVLNRENNKILFRDIVNEHVAVTVPETFFLIDSFLYYIKKTSTLRALDLIRG